MAALVLLIAIATAVYMTVAEARTPSWAVIGLAGAAAVVTGAAVNRPAHRWPWWFLAAALLSFVAGDTIYYSVEQYFHTTNPFPSAADAFYLAVYPLFCIGLYGLVRYRWSGHDLPSLLDALIFTSALALPVWVYLVQPLSVLEGLTWEQRAISIAYPLGDVLVLAMLAGLLTPGTGHKGNRSLKLLVLGSAMLLGFDIVYGIVQLNAGWESGGWIDLGWIVFYTAWGLAALDPSMVELTASVPHGETLIPPPRRLFLLATATLIAPAILLIEGLTGGAEDTAVIAAFLGALFLLVLLRFTGMVVAHRKAVARELALRSAAATLVVADRPDEIARDCDTTVQALIGPDTPHKTLLLPAEQAAELGVRQTRMMPPAELPPALAAEMDGLPCVLLCPMMPPDSQSGEVSGVLLVAGPSKELSETHGSLEILASHAGLAVERFALHGEVIRQENEAYFRTLVRNTSDVILIVEEDDTVRYASPSARAVFGNVPLIGSSLPDLVDPRDRDRAARELKTVRSNGQQPAHDHWWVRREEDRVEVEVRCSDFRGERTVGGLVVTLRDVTEQRRLEHELTQRAFHDSLTGLPNRTLLLERIQRALLRGRRESKLTCLLFIDLDDFKMVNDTMGHAAGDHLLIAVAERLSKALRRTDTAARLGGDEFAVLMEDAKEPLDAELLAAQVIQTLARPFDLPEESVTVTASVGVATAKDSTDGDELLTHADLALYAAKAAGKRQWRRFQPLLHMRMVERHDLQSRLDRAIADKEFTLRYQPVVDIAAGEVVGFEALARWPRAPRSRVSPNEFINLAEETGYITPLGAWVLETAAHDIAGLQRTTRMSTPPYISVNVSARQFRDTGFLDQVTKALHTPGLAAGSLQLELTETVLLRRDDQIEGVLRSLKEMGVRIAVDDFGTGFSSLRYLRDFPIDVLKIDKSFIDDIAQDSQQVALVQGIVHIAETLGLQVIAEGIEESAQRDLLEGIGCQFGQGYLFFRPMTLQQSESVLRRQDSRRPDDQARNGPAPGKNGKPLVLTGGNGGRPAKAGPQAVELERLRQTSRMTDAVLDEVRGRHIRSGDHWLVDFASCNYLGFDWEPEIIGAIEPAVRRWGTHPSWSRLLGSPRLYPEIEERLAALLGAPDTLLLPTLTLIHSSVIPVLADRGHVFVEATAHRTVYDGALAARGLGSTLRRFHADQPGELERLLATSPSAPARLVCIDGVNSMTGNLPDLPSLAAVCRRHDATLYVDDAHGFGVIGERGPEELCSYGSRGNSVVRHAGESYDNIVLVGGFSKAYSSLLAFLALPTALKNRLKTDAAPYLYSGPSPTASLATALAGLDVNDRRGDVIRADLHRKTARVLDHLDGLGVSTLNTDRLPIVEIPLSRHEDLDAVAAFLWEEGIYVTLAAYPLVPRDRVGFRVQLTALNSDDDIDRLNTTLTRLSTRFALRQKG